VVTLKGPGGQILKTPAAPGKIVGSSEYIAVVAPDAHQVIVYLRHPQGGTWRVQPGPGAPPIETPEVAGDMPPATVAVKVRHGHGREWSLAYKVGHYVAGSAVRFVERGRDSTHMLGTVKSAAGTVRFVPEDAISRSRTIVAYLLNAEGAPQRELTVARYTAPGAIRAGRPGRMRIVRRGFTALVSWGPARSARTYAVKIRGSDGRLETRFPNARHRSVAIPQALPFEAFTVTVTARGGPNLLPGPSATGRLAAVKTRRRAPPKRGTGKRKR
jgi:hypothetical protein